MSMSWEELPIIFLCNDTSKISIVLDFHIDTTVVGPNIWVLVMHDLMHHVDMYCYDSKWKHENTTAVDVAIMYVNLLAGVLILGQK